MDKQQLGDLRNPEDLEQIPMADEEGEEDTDEEEAAAVAATTPGTIGSQDQEHRSISPTRAGGDALVGESSK